MTRRSIALIGSRVGMVLLVALGSAESARSAPPAASEASCGVLALTTIMRLEGRAVTADRVATCLPDRPDHSLADLQSAARTLGCPLAGVRLDRRHWPLDRPALVHLDRQGVGHFLVIRAVGSTGHLFQWIDPIGGVEVKEAESIFASREWTGVGLVPTRWSDALDARRAWVVAPLVILAVALLSWRRWSRRRGEVGFVRSFRPARSMTSGS